MNITKTYGAQAGTCRKGNGFYAVVDGHKTDCFYKREANAVESARKMAEHAANTVRCNGHEVKVSKS